MSCRWGIIPFYARSLHPHNSFTPLSVYKNRKHSSETKERIRERLLRSGVTLTPSLEMLCSGKTQRYKLDKEGRRVNLSHGEASPLQ